MRLAHDAVAAEHLWGMCAPRILWEPHVVFNDLGLAHTWLCLHPYTLHDEYSRNLVQDVYVLRACCSRGNWV